MSYLALARQWRPRTFAELIGQEQATKPLTNALNLQRLHHAYLFTGTRGVGKTSIARILAKALNCEQGVSAQPCLQCDACLAIEQGRFLDMIEIDGASKTKVEDTRELLDNVQYAPTIGRFKIYIIDEVHMLSQHSFNALLKTLEEPPLHVKFILATTDAQKIPVTVISRCIQFNLKNLTPPTIANQMAKILHQEQLDYEDDALSILAHAAHGSMRDGLSLLEKAITSCETTLTTSIAKTMLGHTQVDYALSVLTELANNNPQKLMIISDEIMTEGGYFFYVLDTLLNHLHQMAIYQQLGGTNLILAPSTALQQLSAQFSAEDIQLFYQICLKGKDEIQFAPTLGIGFNMLVLRMLLFKPAAKVELPIPTAPIVIQQPTKEVHKQVGNAQNQSTMCTVSSPVMPEKSVSNPPKSIIEQNIPSQIRLPEIPKPPPVSKETSWNALVPQLQLSGLALNAIENAEFVAKEEQAIHLLVAKGHASLFTKTVLAKIEHALQAHYQEPVKLVIKTQDQTSSSLAQQKEQKNQQKQQQAEISLHEDSVFQTLKTEFSAELVKNSIVSLEDGI
jgi:DNA polymerase-3 subunit gamma/tau